MDFWREAESAHQHAVVAASLARSFGEIQAAACQTAVMLPAIICRGSSCSNWNFFIDFDIGMAPERRCGDGLEMAGRRRQPLRAECKRFVTIAARVGSRIVVSAFADTAEQTYRTQRPIRTRAASVPPT